MSTLLEKTKVRCPCGSIIEVDPSEIALNKWSDPVMIAGDMGDYIGGHVGHEKQTCICACDKKNTVLVQHTWTAGPKSSPGSDSRIVS